MSNINQFIIWIIIGVLLPVVTIAQSSERCATMDNLERLERKNPYIKERINQIERFTKRLDLKVEKSYAVEELVEIPVVVHVLYNDKEDTNISDDLIYSQIEVLNQDFRRLNQDTINTPEIFQSVAGDIGIQFCLANVDPNGFATNGITRTFTNISSFAADDKMKFDDLGGKTAWNSKYYLNIWVCDLSNGTLGYAQFPGGPVETDGLVIDYANFGVFESDDIPYNRGRTTTHEVGHWLNLKHIWGDGDCEVDDFVEDTPSAAHPNYANGECSFPLINSCVETSNDLPDMFQNYMDYSADNCMNLFTKGQSVRMRSLFQKGGARNSFLYSQGCSGNGIIGSCDDGVQNNDEENIDCGGSSCNICPESYCTLFGDSEYEWIESIAFKSIGALTIPEFVNQSSQNNGYEFFTQDTIFFKSGSPISFSLTPGFADDSYAEFWKVWIDFNNDKDFEDEGELVFSGDDLFGEVRVDSLMIPEIKGTTRMRIAMNYDYFDENTEKACGVLLFGEVEDYPIVFKDCDNPVDILFEIDSEFETLSINWEAIDQSSNHEINLYILSASGPYWYQEIITGNNFTINDLSLDSSTVIYYKIRTLC
ncbi:MAG: M43 family zinc metalloprotease, partial [Bacteroidota bacterium]